jgi:hypothetical protein
MNIIVLFPASLMSNYSKNPNSSKEDCLTHGIVGLTVPDAVSPAEDAYIYA